MHILLIIVLFIIASIWTLFNEDPASDDTLIGCFYAIPIGIFVLIILSVIIF